MSINVNVVNGTLAQEEIEAYIGARARKIRPRAAGHGNPRGWRLRDIDYDFGSVPFQRIRRITGYLVGTLDRFNDGKRAEERDPSSTAWTALQLTRRFKRAETGSFFAPGPYWASALHIRPAH